MVSLYISNRATVAESLIVYSIHSKSDSAAQHGEGQYVYRELSCLVMYMWPKSVLASIGLIYNRPIAQRFRRRETGQENLGPRINQRMHVRVCCMTLCAAASGR